MKLRLLQVGSLFLLLLAAGAAEAQTSADRLAEAKTARDAGNHEEAIRLYRTLVDDPDPAVRALALEAAALLLSWRGEYDDSVDYYRRVAEIAPGKRRDAIYGAARTLGWARRHNEGLQELQPLIDENPEDKEIRLLEAQISGWGGFTDRSVAAFRKVIEIDPQDREARLGLAKVLAWGGRLAESEDEFEDLLERFPDYDDGRMGIAYTLMWQGRPHNAKKHFDLISPAFHDKKDYKILRVAMEWALMDRGASVGHRRDLMRELPGEPDVRDLWRAQAGVVGHNVRGDAYHLEDNQGLGITTAGLGGTARLGDPAFLFGDARKEWLTQEGSAGGFPEDEVHVKGGRVGLDWDLGPVGLRGSLGSRTSNADTGGTVGGVGLTALIRPNLGMNLNLDSDFAFFTPKAVRSDVRMTGINLGLWKALTSRLGMTAGYSRTHFEGPDGSVRVSSPPPGQRQPVDQNRDLLNAAFRHQTGGFGGNWGNVRVDLGIRGLYFRFDRQFPDVGYWNPRRFRQVMGVLGGTYRKGEEFTLIANAHLGVQKQDDAEWESALYLYTEALRQLGRRTDAWARADYSNSGLTRQVAAGYRAWSVAGGLLVRIGDRTPDAEPTGAPPQPARPIPFPPPTQTQ